MPIMMKVIKLSVVSLFDPSDALVLLPDAFL
jgi:hypothetical protein